MITHAIFGGGPWKNDIINNPISRKNLSARSWKREIAAFCTYISLCALHNILILGKINNEKNSKSECQPLVFNLKKMTIN